MKIFSDKIGLLIARNLSKSELDIRKIRINNKCTPSYKIVDTCAAEFEAQTPYCYSTYDNENEINSVISKFKKI